MALDKAQAGWERQVFVGPPGGTASTQLLHLIDAGVSKRNERTETTDRGDGTEIPISTQQTVARGAEATFSVRYYASDSDVADLIAAAEEGEPRAIKILRSADGVQELDADVDLDYDSPGGLKDGMPIDFTATLNRDYGRMPDIVSA